MKLSKEEKEMLKSWLAHPWRAIAERFDQEQIQEITKYITSTIDFSKTDEVTLRALHENQIAMNSVAKYFKGLASLVNSIVVPK